MQTFREDQPVEKAVATAKASRRNELLSCQCQVGQVSVLVPSIDELLDHDLQPVGFFLSP